MYASSDLTEVASIATSILDAVNDDPCPRSPWPFVVVMCVCECEYVRAAVLTSSHAMVPFDSLARANARR